MGGARAAPPPIPIPTPIRKSAHGTAPEMAARTRSAAAQPAAAALRRALPRPRQRQGGGDPRRLFRPESAGDKSRSARIRLHNKQRALDGIARLLGLYGRGARLPYADPQERMAAAIQ